MKNLHVIWILAFAFLINACKKTEDANNQVNQGKATYQVRMTDAPGPYQQVNIDLRGVEITGTGGSTMMLNVNAGIYDLLKFSNGLDTLIASGSINAGRVEQIRLILGPNNTVVVNGDAFPLDIPSSEQSGLKIQVHQDIAAGATYMVLLDFDANRSIHQLGNGSYKMKPVIRAINKAVGGAIKGSVIPAGVIATVTANNGVDSFSSVVNVSGNFLIMGLTPGNYDVTVVPVAPYKTVVKTAITVTAGATADAGIIDVN